MNRDTMEVAANVTMLTIGMAAVILGGVAAIAVNSGIAALACVSGVALLAIVLNKA